MLHSVAKEADSFVSKSKGVREYNWVKMDITYMQVMRPLLKQPKQFKPVSYWCSRLGGIAGRFLEAHLFCRDDLKIRIFCGGEELGATN
jgi:hypothetical protein